VRLATAEVTLPLVATTSDAVVFAYGGQSGWRSTLEEGRTGSVRSLGGPLGGPSTREDDAIVSRDLTATGRYALLVWQDTHDQAIRASVLRT
jgi:hypothetical protein